MGGLLCAGVLSQSQVLLAFGVVAELFNGVRDAEPLDGDLQSIIPTCGNQAFAQISHKLHTLCLASEHGYDKVCMHTTCL